MTSVHPTGTGTHRIDLVVPDVDLAAEHLAQIVGTAPSSARTGRILDPSVSVGLLASQPGSSTAAPRVVDVGTHHLCWRVTDIDAAAAHIDAAVDGSEILGDIITIPDGPIAGNRWVYYRSPWGVLFELQQWPQWSPYMAETDVRLDHTRHVVPSAPLPGFAGVDHSGYSVADIDATIETLTRTHGARVALRTEIEAGRDFMAAQFGIDVEGTSKMAMLDLDGLIIELFEHRVEGRRPQGSPTAVGGHTLVPRSGSADLARTIVDGSR